MLWDHIHTDCLPGGAWRGYLGLLTARGARRGNFWPKPPKVLKGDLRRPKLKIAKSAAASRPPALKHPKQAGRSASGLKLRAGTHRFLARASFGFGRNHMIYRPTSVEGGFTMISRHEGPDLGRPSTLISRFPLGNSI